MIIQAKDFTKDLMAGKKLVSFDADGTLVESKTKMSPTMVGLFNSLLEKYFVNVISGGKYQIFEENVLEEISSDPKLLSNLTLSPTCGTVMYINENETWKICYKDALDPDVAEEIIRAIEYAMEKIGHNPTETFGDIIENRETQITFSALGQKAPLALKEAWDPDQKIRHRMIEFMKEQLSNLDIKIGGTTSIDVTKAGINKAFGVKKLMEHYGLGVQEVLFVGDALFEGGNDKPVSDMGVLSVQVNSVTECEELIRKILN
ncbi:MAG: HAD-IIB family hydrolase [bacterium]|nr:HAD-IIB family hydrolase [bacterium]